MDVDGPGILLPIRILINSLSDYTAKFFVLTSPDAARWQTLSSNDRDSLVRWLLTSLPYRLFAAVRLNLRAA